jgi:tetratricopeptide (TPR) repeat protein
MKRTLTASVLSFLILAALLGTPLSWAESKWVEVRSPNFIIVSNAGEKQARKTAIHFEQIRAVFRRSLQVANEHPTPIITILAVKDEGSMKSLLPEFWTKNHIHPAGIFMERENQSFAAVQLNLEEENPYHVIFHEYYHTLTLPYYPNLPLWVAEGLADFWGNTVISDTDVQMGKPDSNLVAELRESKLIPLEVLFKVDHNSPYYNEQDKGSIFYAEAWALTHYLMIGDKASHRAMLSTYLNAISQGATPEEAGTKAFGDLKRFQSTLETYIRSNSFYILKSGAPPAIADSDLHVRELSEAEVGAYRGGFEAVSGREKEAITMLESAVKADPKLAMGYGYLGFAEYAAQQPNEALADLSRAIELDPNNALTRFQRAHLYLITGTGDRDKIVADLRAAIAADPNFAPACGFLAVYLTSSSDNLPEAFTLAKKGMSLQPGNSSYQFDMAQVLDAMHRTADARKMANAANTNAIAPEQKAQALALLAHLDQEQNQRGGQATEAQADDGEKRLAFGAETSARAKAGVTNSVEGDVKEVSCAGKELMMTLTTNDKTIDLHAKDETRVQYEQDVAFDAGVLQPCTQLEGHHVVVMYVSVNGQKYVGEIQSIELMK